MAVTAPVTTTLDPATTPNFNLRTFFSTNDSSVFSVLAPTSEISIDVAKGGKYAYSISCKVFLSAARLANGPFPGERVFFFGLSSGFFDAQWDHRYFSDAERQMKTSGNYDVSLHITGTLDIAAAFSAFPFLQAMPVLAAALTDGVTCNVLMTRLGEAST